jgi:glycosyltransferase involved in cell wall biosynthesis
MKVDTVDVVIPNYGRTDQLRNAVLSAVNQDHPINNIWIIDDGSDNSTKTFYESLIDEFSQIRLVLMPHQGIPGYLRNLALSLSSADFIAFLDSDDFWFTNKISRQINEMKAAKLEASCTNALVFGPGTASSVMHNFLDSSLDFRTIVGTNLVINSSLVVKRTRILELGGYPRDANLKSVEDYAFALRLSSREPICVIDEPLMIYSESIDSIRKDFVDVDATSSALLDFLCWSVKAGHLRRRPLTLLRQVVHVALKVGKTLLKSHFVRVRANEKPV